MCNNVFIETQPQDLGMISFIEYYAVIVTRVIYVEPY